MTSGGNKSLDALVRGELEESRRPERLACSRSTSAASMQTQPATSELAQAVAPGPDAASGAPMASPASARCPPWPPQRRLRRVCGGGRNAAATGPARRPRRRRSQAASRPYQFRGSGWMRAALGQAASAPGRGDLDSLVHCRGRSPFSLLAGFVFRRALHD